MGEFRFHYVPRPLSRATMAGWAFESNVSVAIPGRDMEALCLSLDRPGSGPEKRTINVEFGSDDFARLMSEVNRNFDIQCHESLNRCSEEWPRSLSLLFERKKSLIPR